MPEAFNAGIDYRLSPRTPSPSMLRPRTAPAKHYLLSAASSPQPPLRAAEPEFPPRGARELVPRPTRAGSTSTQASANVTRASQPKASNAAPPSLPSMP
jgi:hypothetical protein